MEGGQDPDCRRPMIWNENRQDKDLLKFMQYLIGFRKRNIDFINKCSMEFSVSETQNDKWTFRHENNFINLHYINKKLEIETNLV
jgi:glycosidase